MRPLDQTVLSCEIGLITRSKVFYEFATALRFNCYKSSLIGFSARLPQSEKLYRPAGFSALAVSSMGGACQKRTVPSSEPLISQSPSLEKARLFTVSVCP